MTQTARVIRPLPDLTVDPAFVPEIDMLAFSRSSEDDCFLVVQPFVKTPASNSDHYLITAVDDDGQVLQGRLTNAYRVKNNNGVYSDTVDTMVVMNDGYYAMGFGVMGVIGNYPRRYRETRASMAIIHEPFGQA